VHVLRAQGHTLREISRLLHLARNTVRRILRCPPQEARGEAAVAARADARAARIAEVFGKARGNAVRARELLAEQGVAIAYSSLTPRCGRRSCARESGVPASIIRFTARRCSTIHHRTG
jgi:hypothetical protein